MDKEGPPPISQKIYHFVITDDKYIKRFCTTMLIFEKFCVKKEQTGNERNSIVIPKIPIKKIIENPFSLDPYIETLWLPKSISLISRLPVFELEKSLLKCFFWERDQQISLDLTIKEKFDFFLSQPSPDKNREDGEWSRGEKRASKKKFGELKKIRKKEVEQERENSEAEKKISQGKKKGNGKENDEGQIKEEGKEGYKGDKEKIRREQEKKAVRGWWEEREGESVNKIEKERNVKNIRRKRWVNEFYVSAIFSLLRLTDDCDISFKGLNNEELFRFRISDEIGIGQLSFSMKPLLSKLSLDNILKIVKFLLLEKRLLFVSKNPGVKI